MQLDHTRIVIRERSLLEVLDLALCVIRAYAWPLVVALAVGVVPFMLLNAWLLSGLPEIDAEEEWFRPDYVWWMLLLVIWETPLVTSLVTLYLGEAIFLKRPSVGGLVRAFFRALPQLFLYNVVLRGLFIPMVVTLFVPYGVWPYMTEVILLERNPLRRRASGQITTFRRVQALHSGAGDLFGRWMASAVLGAVLLVSVWLSLSYLTSMLLGEEALRPVMFTLLLPLALWTVVGYFTVVRFLGYLDLRIRREGWEVELALRAEGARLSRQMT